MLADNSQIMADHVEQTLPFHFLQSLMTPRMYLHSKPTVTSPPDQKCENKPVQPALPEIFNLIKTLQSSPRFPVDFAFMLTESLDPALPIHALQMCSDVPKRLLGNLIH